MMILVSIIIMGIYITSPIIGKIALLLANMVLPDPIPFVDEFIMWIGLFTHLSRLMDVAEFIRNHKVGVMVGVIILMLILIFILF